MSTQLPLVHQPPPAEESSARLPHPATVVQRSVLHPAMRDERYPPHPATVVQRSVLHPAMRDERYPPHPATVVQRSTPHAARPSVRQHNPEPSRGGVATPAENNSTLQPSSFFASAYGAASSLLGSAYSLAVANPVVSIPLAAYGLYKLYKTYSWYTRSDIVFWNAQHTSADPNSIKRQYMARFASPLVLLCEVTDAVDRQGHVQKQDVKRDRAQLGYGATSGGGAYQLTPVDIRNYNTLFPNNLWQDYDRRGGNQFLQTGGSDYSSKYGHSKRRVMHAGRVNGINVFVYHANSGGDGGDAPMLVRWVVTQLNIDYPGGFVLVGDLNCNPPALVNLPAGVQTADGGPTHHRVRGLVSTYDYAVYKGCTVGVWRVTNLPGNPSDHLPIVVNIDA